MNITPRRTMPIVLIVFLLGYPRCARAEDTPKASTVAPYCVLIAGNVADLVTTQRALSRGAIEGNPALGSSAGRIATQKALGTAGTAVVMYWLARSGHPTIAKWIGYVNGSVMFAAALHNQQVRR